MSIVTSIELNIILKRTVKSKIVEQQFFVFLDYLCINLTQVKSSVRIL